MQPTTSIQALPRHQRGAALIVSLVLLVILTVLTASSMNSTTVSLRMADNVRQKERAGQAGESALMQELNSQRPLSLKADIGVFPDPIEGNLPFARPGVQNYKFGEDEDNPDAEANVLTVLRDRTGAYLGCEMNDATLGSTGCVDQHFELRVIATAGRSGSSEQRMGFYLRVPK